MLIIGALYASDSVKSTGPARWVVIILVFVFGLTYTATWGIVGKMYASEIQPSATRSSANAAAQGLGFFTNWLVAILTPIFLANSSFGAYFIFGGFSLSTMLVLWAYMPETRGQSLEAIEEAFKQPIAASDRFQSLLRRWTGGSRNSSGTPSQASSGNTSNASVRGGESIEMSGTVSADGESTASGMASGSVPSRNEVI